MAGKLLLRGMLAGIIAAIVSTLFARIFAEPQVDLAIAFEAANSHAHHAAHMMAAAAEEPELVSRATQKGLGLLTALGLYGAAVGGIFSLIFAYCYGRVALIGPRSLALLLAVGAFVVIALIPAIKYPPTPPAVGQHETVALRTAAYFAIIGFGIIAMLIALRVRTALNVRIGAFNAALAATAAFIVLIGLLQRALPVINEVPHNFPAVVLWDFRVASIATQAVLWTVIGTIFGALANRSLSRR